MLLVFLESGLHVSELITPKIVPRVTELVNPEASVLGPLSYLKKMNGSLSIFWCLSCAAHPDLEYLEVYEPA